MPILIVDDARTFRYLLVKVLNEIGYPDVLAASCVEEAKKILTDQKPYLVICDWHMPVQTGLDLLKFIRKTPEIANIPFVMMTTENDKSKILDAIKIGMQAYLFKPVQKKILTDKLTELSAKYKFRPPS